MLFCKNLTKSFGPQTLFSEANFQLNLGEKIGVVGRNGSGKSTLFRLILGEDAPDEGTISFPENYRIGGLDQQLAFSQESIVKELSQNLPLGSEHDVWKAEKLLSGLGFRPSDFEKSPLSFSGGFQIRVKLAQLLLSQPDLLLLDEPTNYLDIVAIRWLERFLKNMERRTHLHLPTINLFWNELPPTPWPFIGKKFKKLKGSPSQCYGQIKKEESLHERTRKNDQKATAKQEKFIREFRSGARSAGLVQSRIKMLEKKEKLGALPSLQEINFNFTETDFNGAKMLDGHNLCFQYKEGPELLKKISIEILPGDRIGIIGANGKGKSTLLRILNQELKIQNGTLKQT